MDGQQKKQAIVIVLLLALLGGVWYVVIFGWPAGRSTPAPRAETADHAPRPDVPEPAVIRQLVQRTGDFLAQHTFDLDPVPEPEDAEASPADPVPDEADDERDEPVVDPEIPRTVDDDEEVLAALPGLDLSAIIWTQAQPVAIINGRIVRVGDTVAEDVRVEAIRVDSVRLTQRRNDTVRSITLLLTHD